MATMMTMPQRRGLTRADLAGMPDDGWRYELIDGVLLVSPAPGYRHQRGVANLIVSLTAACPTDLVVMPAPFAVGLADDTEVQPDVLVAPLAQLTAADLPGAPLLAVEILAPSTRLIDLNLKMARYELAGCPHYWVLDPVATRLLVWELREGRYEQTADVTGDEAWTASAPFAVTLTPSALVE